ncbi:MAG: ATP-binding protein [Phaeodactylibacter sp.]|nr:ATP-binding protein [Phaeodactylibacter sp.]
MATSEQLKALIKSHFEGDAERFLTTALQLAAHEARKGHSAVAQDIRLIVDKGKQSSAKILPIKPDLEGLVIVVEPNIRLSQLVLPETLINKIKRILREFRQRSKLLKHGLSNRRKILLTGPPGTGKTMTAYVMAAEMKLPLYVVLVDKLVTKYMGETSAKLRQIFDLIQEKQALFLFDEFDAIGAERSRDNDVGEMRRVLNAFLQYIERDDSDSFIVAATNSIDVLDQALFRRFDDILQYAKPTESDIIQLVENRLGTFKAGYAPSTIAKVAEGLSHAEVAQACDDAIKEAILSGKTKVKEEHLLETLRDRKEAYRSFIAQQNASLTPLT